MKLFIGIPEEKTEDRSELSKGPKENRRWDGTTQRIQEETVVTDETVHWKPRRRRCNRRRPMKPFIGNLGGNRRQVGTVQVEMRGKTGSSGDERKRWVGFRRRLLAGAILGRPAC